MMELTREQVLPFHTGSDRNTIFRTGRDPGTVSAFSHAALSRNGKIIAVNEIYIGTLGNPLKQFSRCRIPEAVPSHMRDLQKAVLIRNSSDLSLH